jgi:DnaJ-class molecular chaperone
MAEDYYSILGVTKDATSQEIKRAFREIARKCHPDLAGTDPAAEEQFKNARKAYETLMDPVARARYDRRGQRAPPGSFFEAFYKAAERKDNERAQQAKGQPQAKGPQPVGGGRMNVRGTASTGRQNPGNDVSLDDLFNDFGDFGFNVKAPAGRAPSDPGSVRAAPMPGEDVHIELDVPADLARSGGSLTAVYYRMQRADSWRPGAPDPGLVRVQDIADIRVVPNTSDGEVLRERGLGNAGSYGGAYGDLLVRVRITAPRVTPGSPGTNGQAREPQPQPEPARPGPTDNGHAQAPVPEPAAGPGPHVDLTIVEALLGGRVSLETPQGKVRLTIPPGTSSGVQLRLKGRGASGADGQPSDYFVWTRIVVPKVLDPESRRLIEEYARLNPSASEE